jgi:chromosomal replication initiator protein
MDEHEILAKVAGKFGVSIEVIRGKKRSQHIAFARQVAMYLIRENTGITWKAIGELLGHRDHSTAMHGWRVIKMRMADASFTRMIDSVGVYSAKNAPWEDRHEFERGCMA